MDLKAFVLGATCGIGVYALAHHVLREEPQAVSTKTHELANGEANSSPVDDENVEPGHAENDSPTLKAAVVYGVDARNETEATGATARATRGTEHIESDQSMSNREKPRKPTRITPGMDSTKLWLDRELSKLQAQPRDDAWAYDMEVAIGQFLTSHPAGGNFEIGYAECRSTLCQIKAIGFDESTGPTWQRIMFDMTRQPWYQFTQSGSSWSQLDGRLVIIHDLYTGPPAEEDQ